MKKQIFACIFLFALAHLGLAADGIISTLVGAATSDNVPATSTLLNSPKGIAIDGVGNIYVSDSLNNRIRRIDASTGIITTVAGTGQPGYSGDFGPAIQARLNDPHGIFYTLVNAVPTLYIADTFNNRIRKLDLSTGEISTVAGNGIQGYGGDEISGVDPGWAIDAAFNLPHGVVASSAGTLWVMDTYNQRVRRVDTNQKVTTVAGTGAASYGGDGGNGRDATLYYPVHGALGGNYLYVSDQQNSRVRRLDLSTNIIGPWAGNGGLGYGGDGGAPGSASFYYPRGLFMDSAQNLYVADLYNHRIRRVNAAGSLITTVAGRGAAGYDGDGGAATAAALNSAEAVAMDQLGNLYIADTNNNCVRKVNPSGTSITTIAGTGVQDGVPGTQAILGRPGAVRIGAPGELLIADRTVRKIRKFNLQNGTISNLAGSGSSVYSGDGTTATAAGLVGPQDFVRDSSGNIYLADNYSTIGIAAGPPSCYTFCIPLCITICFPTFITFTYGESRIRKIDSLGNITTVAGTNELNNTGNGGQASNAKFGLIQGMALYGNTLYVSDSYFQVLRQINLGTGVVTALGGVSGTVGYLGDGAPISGSTRFNSPQGLAVDGSGNLYIADTNNNVVRKVAAGSLSITTICGLGPTFAGYSGDGGLASAATLFNPTGVYVDSGGNIFVADYGNHRIRRIDAATGFIRTVAGSGFAGFAGDGGPALAANLNGPRGVYVDSLNNIFIADMLNGRVRKVDLAAGNPTPVAQKTGQSIAYPSPASDRICFSYQASKSGPVEILVYNAALQLVATIKDQLSAPGAGLTCSTVKGLSPGIYIYRVVVGAENLPPAKFKVMR